MASISCVRLEKSFGPNKALRSVSLDIKDGELFCLLGPSGCGKTTLLRSIAGLIEPDAGDILLDGQNVTTTPAHLRRIGFVFQNYALWPHMTVAENVSYGPKLQKLPARVIQERLKQALEYVKLDGYQGRYPDELSGGQQQRVAVSRALALEPKVMLFDEPLSNLDTKLRNLIREQLVKLHRELHHTIVYVTHDQGEALAMADRLALMDGGQIVQCGTPHDLYFKPATRFAAEFLGTANLLPVEVADLEGGTATAKTPFGCINLPAPPWLAAPQSAFLCIRPSALSLTRESSLRIPVKLRHYEFSGDIERYVLKYGDFTLVSFAPGAGLGVPPGEEVSLFIDTAQLWIVPE